MEKQKNDAQLVELLSTPFTAAIEVQTKMVDTYLQTIKKLAFGSDTGQESGKADVLKITLNRLVKRKNSGKKAKNDDDNDDEKQEKPEKVTQEVEVPIISLVQIPALTMKEVQVDVVLAVDEELNSVKLSSDKSQKYDFSPKYTIKMIADREDMATGMKALTDIMAESMKTVDV